MFIEALNFELQLKIKGKTFDIISGHIKNFEANVFNYGFDAKVDFILTKEYYGKTDELFAAFTTQDLIEVTLKVKTFFNPVDPEPEPLILIGIVRKKAFKESILPSYKDEPILFRHYFIEFADPARVLWGQHHPCELYVDENMKNVISAHTGSKIKMNYKWPVLDVKHAILFLALGEKKNIASFEEIASFWDFMFWYTTIRYGIWAYDTTKNEYTLTDQKTKIDPSGSPSNLNQRDVERVVIETPETVRHNVRVMNAFWENAQTQTNTQEQVVAGTQKDVLIRTHVPSRFTERVNLEKTKLVIRQHELDIQFKKFPTITYYPGILFKIQKSGEWSDKLYPVGKTYRIYELKIKAKAESQLELDDETSDANAYKIEMTSRAELKEETHVKYPKFKIPHYPVHVEGCILSEVEGAEKETYQFYQDKYASLDMYRVKIPLWSNKQVVAEYNPNKFSSHFYFPAIKESQVLVAMGFQEARIMRYLDWRPKCRLPMETQGNHLLFGKNPDDDYTTMNHVYESNKPVFNVKRDYQGDTEMIRMEEGTMIIQTREK